VNEELAATAVQGTQLASASGGARVDGVTGYWYGKSPGADRAADALRHACLMGTHPRGGAVAFVGDDPSAKSSTVPGASEALLADLGLPVLYPADPQDVLDLGTHAVGMSRCSGLWVGLKIVTNVADGTGTVAVDAGRVTPVRPEVAGADGQPFAHQINPRMLQPALSDMEQSREGIRLDAAIAYARANRLNRIEEIGQVPAGEGRPGAVPPGKVPRIGIIAAGKTYLDTRQALRILGLGHSPAATGEGDGSQGEKALGVRLMKLAMIHPLIPAEISEFAAGLDEIIVVEEKRGFLEAAVKDILYGTAGAPRVTGKKAPDGSALFARDGELDADSVAAGLARRLGLERKTRRELPLLPLVPLAARTPYFCSGCPHNTSTKVPDGSAVGAGIGCHALVMLMSPDRVGDVTGMTQMGGEGAQWIGMAPFMKDTTHLLQNLGDGTFHHSGSLAIRASVASGVNVTYKLLYNSAVAMTGGQQPAGVMTIPEITRLLKAEGVGRIIVTTEDTSRYRGVTLAPGTKVWDRGRLEEAQETLARVPGVTVLIHDQECATELRRKRKRGLAPDPVERVMINERICEGCGDCGAKSNCLSVQPRDTEFGRKTAIDQSSCNKDYSCLAGDCPSFLSVVPAGSARGGGHPVAGDLATGALPAPAPLGTVGAGAATSVHTTRITGVGGTGVVTLSQILTAAAMTAGQEVRTLDQTGMAQKGGAVVSDIKIGPGADDNSNKAAEGECDLYLGCDLLVAADPKNLAVAGPGRTVAVVSTSKVPTGAMVTDTAQRFPDVGGITAAISAATVAERAVFADARQLCARLLGSDQFANMFLTGVAFQAGALPLPAEAVERAIELNGAAVRANQQAFRRGRQYVADPDAFAAAVKAMAPEVPDRELTQAERDLIASAGADAGGELERLVTIRVRDLTDYQDLAYARQYAAFVARVRRAEHDAVGKTELTEAVARYLHKLMAYKDEYEVARLALAPEAEAAVAAEFGPGAKVSYLLHPPVLRALGMDKKVRLGPWFRPAFGALRQLRRVRGSRLDPFGYTSVRRTERELIGEYRALIEGALATLTADSHARAVELAALPDLIRGYENIKLANVARFRDRARELSTAPPAPMKEHA
jgi:indolepyruvate ferredoxin oxidoreductase